MKCFQGRRRIIIENAIGTSAGRRQKLKPREPQFKETSGNGQGPVPRRSTAITAAGERDGEPVEMKIESEKDDAGN